MGELKQYALWNGSRKNHSKNGTRKIHKAGSETPSYGLLSHYLVDAVTNTQLRTGVREDTSPEKVIFAPKRH